MKRKTPLKATRSATTKKRRSNQLYVTSGTIKRTDGFFGIKRNTLLITAVFVALAALGTYRIIAATTYYSMFKDLTPAVTDSNDTQAVELGVKFTPNVSGTVNGVKFYKSAANTGTHTGTLWTSSGQKLASLTFTHETASGWQKSHFKTPVAVTAGTTYIISYHTNVGHYAYNYDYFTRAYTRAPLTAPASSGNSPNGVYKYGVSAFPNESYRSTNYWVDVVFAVESTPTPPTPPPTPAPTTPQPVGVGGNWTLQFADEFNGTSLNTANWATQEPWNTAPGYTPPDGTNNDGWCPIPLPTGNDLVVEGNGVLKLNAVTRPTNGKPMQACMVTSRGKRDFTQGYFETRVKVPSGADLWPSFWLLGNNQWPGGGEIDLFEFVNNGRENGTPFFTVHYGGACPDNHCSKTKDDPYPPKITDYASRFITFGLERTATELKVYVDGQFKYAFNSSMKNAQGVTLAPQLFNAPAHLRFDLEIGGPWANDPSKPGEPGTYEIDYVRVWR